MGIIGIILLVLFFIAAVLIIFLVLIQDEQGEGMGGLFGGGSATPFGATSGNILTKTTSVLGAVFMAVSLLVAFALRSTADDTTIQEARQLQGTTDWFSNDAPADTPAQPLLSE